MVSAIFGTQPEGDGSKFSSTQPIHTSLLESILVVCFTIVTVLVILPCDYIDGGPVPTIIFKGLPSIFHAFVIFLVFAFSGALSALLIHDRSVVAKLCEFCSMASMTSAMALLLWATLFTVVFRPKSM